MLFNSLIFPLFFAVFLAGYFASAGRTRLWVCLLGSYFFYGWWDWRFVALLIASTAFNYWMGEHVTRARAGPRRRWLVLAVSANLAVLAFFKYLLFFADSLATTLSAVGVHLPAPEMSIILPVGISFFTFQALSYVIDLYRGDLPEPEPDPVRFAAYIALFPQLVAGPIVRASRLLPQMRVDHSLDWARAGRGAELMAWGFFLKLCLADNAAAFADPRFNRPELFNGLDHVLGTLAFAAQIYGDFAGYSLIAIGIGQVLGFDFGRNFARPYFAASFSEFWQRWHISLSSWLRDYLYVPLGGNRGGTLGTFRNLMLTMLLGGLWHGAAWTFVIWGLLHGVYLVVQRLCSASYQRLCATLHIPAWLARVAAVLIVFVLTCFAWIFFRADSLDQAMQILDIIATGDYRIEQGRQTTVLVRTLLVAMVVFSVDLVAESARLRSLYTAHVALRATGVAVLILMIALLGAFEGSAFIYFQF